MNWINRAQHTFWFGLGITILAYVSFLGYTYHQLIKHLNTYVIEGYGDGMKIYTNLAYHVKHDTSYLHFEGMNFPYGEHVIPADCQFTLSTPLKWLYHNGLPVDQHILGIQNGFLLLSIVLGGVFLYLIFWNWKLPWWWSAIGAFGIGMLAPQIERFGAHLNLGYLFVLPGLFWLLQKQERKPKFGTSLLI